MNKYIQPDYDKLTLLTIDVQNDFSLPGAVMEIRGPLDVIPNIVKLLLMLRESSKPIVHIVRLYKEDGSNVDNVRRKWIESGVSAARPGTEGAELVKELKPNDTRLNSAKLLKGGIQEIALNEFIIYKTRWGAFYKTPLEKFLKRKGVNTLVFTGCNFPNCPRTSIYEASERDFKIVVIQDAISGVYEKGLVELDNIGCEIISASEFIEKFSLSKCS